MDVKLLYHELIIDHGRHPRNFGAIDHATHVKEGFNPLCGDRLTVYLSKQNDLIENLKFTGSGCAISMASASIMSELVQRCLLGEVEKIFQVFHRLVTQGSVDSDMKALNKLKVLAGVSQFPMRVKCATLAWHTMIAALKEDPKIVSTEQIH